MDTRQIRRRKVKLRSITTSGQRGLGSCGSRSAEGAYWLYAWSVSSYNWCKRDAHKILDVNKMQTLSPASASRFGAQFFRRQQQILPTTTVLACWLRLHRCERKNDIQTKIDPTYSLKCGDFLLPPDRHLHSTSSSSTNISIPSKFPEKNETRTGNKTGERKNEISVSPWERDQRSYF